MIENVYVFHHFLFEGFPICPIIRFRVERLGRATKNLDQFLGTNIQYS